MIRIDTAAPKPPPPAESLPWDEDPVTTTTTATTPGETPGEVLTPTIEPMALVSVEGRNIEKLFTSPGALTPMLEALAAHVRAIPRDVSTKAGREAVASLAFKVAKSKTYLDGIGKELTDELKEKPKKVDAARKAARDFLDALKDEVRRPLTLWEENQQEQDEALAKFASLPEVMAHATPENLMATIESLQDPMPEAWDRLEELEAARRQAVAALEALHAAAVQREKDAADLARLRAAEAARLAEEARKKEEERIRQEAEAKAAREAQEALDRAAREQAAAEQRAKAAEARAEQERQAAEALAKKAAEDAVKAEQARQAELTRQNEAQAALAKAQADAAAADVEHRRTFNREALADITQAIRDADPNAQGLEPMAETILRRIIAGRVRHIAITY